MSDERLIALRFPVALVLSIVCLAAPAWADFKAGENAHHRGDYATALREWQPLAKQGHAVAQYNLGLLYTNGQGVPKDEAQARQWFEKAIGSVDLGNASAAGKPPEDRRLQVFLCHSSDDNAARVR